jgi:hypothetical protein
VTVFRPSAPAMESNFNIMSRTQSPLLLTIVAVSAILAVVGWRSATAHHSFAQFDDTLEVTVKGTVVSFDWTNPHSWLHLLVSDPKTGDPVAWDIEGGSPSGLARQGWTRNSIKRGDNAVVVVHPLKAGGPGGSWVHVYINGNKIGTL